MKSKKNKKKLKVNLDLFPVIPSIPVKSDAYALFHAGAFGNKPRAWKSLDELYSDDYRGLVTVRYAVPDRKFTAAHIPFDQVPARVAEWIAKGADKTLFRPNESLPDERLAIQGEWVDNYRTGGTLRYSTASGLSMRQAMENPQYATGVRAELLLRHFLDPDSLENFYDLRSHYSNSIIEFATYECFVGQSPRRNTIIFEIRNF